MECSCSIGFRCALPIATDAERRGLPGKSLRCHEGMRSSASCAEQGSGCIIHLNIALSMVVSLYFGVEKAMFQMGKMYILRSPGEHTANNRSTRTMIRVRPSYRMYILLFASP